MDETSQDDLREELTILEAAEARISAERRRLHDQIDYGYSTAETRAREREVSDQRRQLHQRIDSLRQLLGAAAQPKISRLSEWSGISADVAATYNADSNEDGLET